MANALRDKPLTKTLLTLCAGAIALSVTFVEKVGSAGLFKPLLYLSWGILVLGLLLNVRGFLLLQNSYDRLLDMNDELYDRGTTLLTNPFRTRVVDFNRYSFWYFVVGIVLLLLFAGVNYQSTSKESLPSERTIVIVEDSQGVITRIFEVPKTGRGPNVVKLPHVSEPGTGKPPATVPSRPAGTGNGTSRSKQATKP
jgi:hypothetical protein